MKLGQVFRLRGVRHRPSIFDKDFLFLNALALEIERAAQEIPGKELTILDVGSGTKPYRSFFEGKYRSFIGLDMPPPYGEVDVLASGEQLPVRTGAADVCLCTQVLEHVQRPEAVMAELGRIVKPGGTLLMATHGVYHHHAFPTDYWRWTDEGLKKITLDHFSTADVRPNGGTVMLLFHIVNRGVFHPSEHKPGFKFLQYTVYPVINVMGWILGRLIKETSLSVNYLVVARK